MTFHGIWGLPFMDLEGSVDATALPAVHAEIPRGLLEVAPRYTGGSLKWMGVCAPWVMDDGFKDVNFVLEAMSDEDFVTFCALGDAKLDPQTTPRTFGDETDRPLSRNQERWLEMAHGVYFPWKTCYHFLENDRWDDKHSGAGKTFAPEAEAAFPKTLAFLRSLPFREIGRAVLFGVHSNDHAPFHRDSEPGSTLSVPQSISIYPDARKKLTLASEDGETRLDIDARLFWFNDMDYHGVDAAPEFRWSIRVDGVFEPAWLRDLERRVRRRR